MDKFRILQAQGLVLQPTNTLLLQNSQPIVASSVSLARFRQTTNPLNPKDPKDLVFGQEQYFPLGSGDQFQTACCAHPQEPIVASFLSGKASSITFTNTQSQTSISFAWPHKQASAMCYSRDGRSLLVTQRFPAAIYVVAVDGQNSFVCGQITELLPPDAPFAPRFLEAHPEDPNLFLVEIGLRSYILKLHIRESTDPSAQQICDMTLIHIVQMAGAAAGCFARYKAYIFVAGGFPDSYVRLSCFVDGDAVIPYQFSDKAPEEEEPGKKKNPLPTFQSQLAKEAPFSFKQTHEIFVPKIVPKEAQQPKYGITTIASSQLEIIVGCRGGMVVRLAFASRLKQIQREEKFEDSDEQVQEAPEEEDVPILSMKNVYNLNVEKLIVQQIGANSPASSADVVASQQEETGAWSDSRCQIDLFDAKMTSDSVYCIVFDPVTIQAIPIRFKIEVPVVKDFVQNATLSNQVFSVLHPIQSVTRAPIVIFGLIYYQQINSMRGILQQIADAYTKNRTQQQQKLSLLQIATGQLDSQADQNPLLAGHVPSAVNTAQISAVPFRVLCSPPKNGRFAVATREGLLYLCTTSGQVAAQARLIDAILRVDIDGLGEEVTVTCTDSIRIFRQNAQFLNQICDLQIKMAQQLLIGRGVTVVCAGGQINVINNVTRKILQKIDGHNAPVQSVCFSDDKQQTYATCDAKGMLQLWKVGQDKALVEYNCRGDITSLQQYKIQTVAAHLDVLKNRTFMCAVINGAVCVVDPANEKFALKGVLVSDSKVVAVKQVLVYSEEKVLVTDAAGCMWTVQLPFENMFPSPSQQGLNTAVYVPLQGRMIGRYSFQLDVLKEFGSKELNEVSKIVGEQPLNFCFSDDKQYVALAGAQPGGQVTLLKTDEISTVKVKNLQSVDMSLLLRLLKIKNDLQERLVQVQLDFEHQIRVQQQNNQAQIEMQKGLAEKEVKQQIQQARTFVTQAEKEAEFLEQKLQELDQTNSDELQKIESKFREEVAKIQQQRTETEQLIQRRRDKHNQQTEKLRADHLQQLEQLNSKKDEEMRYLDRQRTDQLSQIENLNAQFNEQLTTADEDADVQLTEQKQRSLKELERKQVQIQTFVAEAGMIRNKFGSIRKQTLAFISNLTAAENTIQTLKQQLDQLQAIKYEKEKEKDMRRAAISDAETKIYQRKQEAKELEKSRFVLDHNIKDLRKKIQPREQEIHDFSEQTKDLAGELEKYHGEIQAASQFIVSCREEEQVQKQALLKQKQEDLTQKQKLQKLEYEVARLVEAHGAMSYDQLQRECIQLQKYGGKDVIDVEKVRADQEKSIHKKFLYDAALQLADQLQVEKEAVVSQNQKIVEENTELLKEAAVLRREIQKIVQQPVSQNNTESQKVFQMRITAQEAEIKRLTKRLRDLEEMQDEDL